MSLLARGVRTIREEGLDRVVFLAIRYLSYTIGYHSLIRRLPSQLATFVFKLTVWWVRLLIKSLHQVYPNRYTDADPYKRISVDPSTIECTSGASRRRGWVVDAEWGQSGYPFMERTYPKAIEQRFVKDFEWEETVLAEEHDRSQLEERTNKIEHLYQHIRDEEYKSQQKLLAESPNKAWSGCNDAMHPLANEVAVDIGPNGEIFWTMCGQHRLAIAKVLQIDRIPVQVFRRHKNWQAIRERARRGDEIPDEVRDHPDLANILEDE